MKGRLALGALAGAALAGCNFDAAYGGYCAAHPADCADGGGAGGGGGDPATQLRLTTPARPYGFELRRCVPGFIAESVNAAGEPRAFGLSGAVELSLAPGTGAELYAGSTCNLSWGTRKDLAVAAFGGALNQGFSLQASRAGSYRVSAATGILGVSNAPPVTLDFPAQAVFAGAPARLGPGDCAGPVAVLLVDDGGVAIESNAPVLVDFSSTSSSVSLMADSSCDAGVGAVVLGDAGLYSSPFFLRSTAGAGAAALQARVGIHLAARRAIDLGGGGACLGPGDACLPAASTPCCDGGTCTSSAARGFSTCQ